MGRLIGTLARMHGPGQVGRPFAVFKPFKLERLFNAPTREALEGPRPNGGGVEWASAGVALT